MSNIHWLDETPSTNDVAKQWALQGYPDMTAIAAHRQTAGRGRHGRTWLGSEGNLFYSLILRPTRSTQEWTAIPLAMGLGLWRAARALGLASEGMRIKWPNDLHVNRQKLAGILVEATGEAAIVGVGMNITQTPPMLDIPATSLHQQGVYPTLQTVVEEVHTALITVFRQWNAEGFAGMQPDWLAHAAGLGEEISVTTPSERITGHFQTVETDGTLVLKTSEATRRITTGDVWLTPNTQE